MTQQKQAQQGHPYTLNGRKVISMGHGPVVSVREVTGDIASPLGKPETVNAGLLTELPLRYLHGEVPA
jgi:hypothetical protein